jgi:hypothetical protein
VHWPQNLLDRTENTVIGALMNTGVNGLIVLNIGLELKVLTPEVFTMMVIMALVTTFMTGPALDLINYLFKSKVVPDAEEITNQSTEYYFHLVTRRGKSIAISE